jgi:hypothetical protein
MGFVDGYLARWTQFAQGDNSLASSIKQDQQRFESQLSRLLQDGDPQAPARAVFYTVVQVGGSIPVESELGQAMAPLLGPDFPTITSEAGPPSFLSVDLYFWWLDNASRYQPFQLFDDWSQTEFARNVVIPMYEAARTK